MSDWTLGPSSLICSGDMYAGEPRKPSICVWVACETFAVPKSLILMSSRSESRMFGRLDVAVDHAVLEGVVERAAHLEDDQHSLAHGQQVRFRAELLQRPARHVLHDDVARVAVHDRVEDPHDVRVVQLARERRLVQEELLEALGLFLGQLRVALVELDGDLAVVERILAEVDVGRRALPELRKEVYSADLERALGPSRRGLPAARYFDESLTDWALARPSRARARAAAMLRNAGSSPCTASGIRALAVVAVKRPPVRGVVVAVQQVATKRLPFAAPKVRLPALDAPGAVQPSQALELLGERRGLAAKWA